VDQGEKNPWPELASGTTSGAQRMITNISDNELRLKKELDKAREEISQAYLRGFKEGQHYEREDCARFAERLWLRGDPPIRIAEALRGKSCEKT
jgi:hypothetical protein